MTTPCVGSTLQKAIPGERIRCSFATRRFALAANSNVRLLTPRCGWRQILKHSVSGVNNDHYQPSASIVGNHSVLLAHSKVDTMARAQEECMTPDHSWRATENRDGSDSIAGVDADFLDEALARVARLEATGSTRKCVG